MKNESITGRLYALHKKHELLWWTILFIVGVLATFVLAYSLAAW